MSLSLISSIAKPQAKLPAQRHCIPACRHSEAFLVKLNMPKPWNPLVHWLLAPLLFFRRGWGWLPRAVRSATHFPPVVVSDPLLRAYMTSITGSLCYSSVSVTTPTTGGKLPAHRHCIPACRHSEAFPVKINMPKPWNPLVYWLLAPLLF